MHPSGLDSACRGLAGSIRPFSPEIVVGILTGGGEVGRRVAAYLHAPAYFEVSLQRPSTHRKHRLGPLLRSLPGWVADRLRIYEARKLSRVAGAPREAVLPEDLTLALRSMSGSGVLIVDDAVDSGATLSAVIRAVKSVVPRAEIRSAALTVTTPHPSVEPEYALWRNEVLLRFPWSLDYKKTRK